MLAKSKLNSIETLTSRTLIDLDISHGEFIRILKEKDKYEKMKENLRSGNEEYKIMRLVVQNQRLQRQKNIFFGYNIKSEILLRILYY